MFVSLTQISLPELWVKNQCLLTGRTYGAEGIIAKCCRKIFLNARMNLVYLSYLG
jgi:hypothetical protein